MGTGICDLPTEVVASIAGAIPDGASLRAFGATSRWAASFVEIAAERIARRTGLDTPDFGVDSPIVDPPADAGSDGDAGTGAGTARTPLAAAIRARGSLLGAYDDIDSWARLRTSPLLYAHSRQ